MLKRAVRCLVGCALFSHEDTGVEERRGQGPSTTSLPECTVSVASPLQLPSAPGCFSAAQRFALKTGFPPIGPFPAFPPLSFPPPPLSLSFLSFLLPPFFSLPLVGLGIQHRDSFMLARALSLSYNPSPSYCTFRKKGTMCSPHLSGRSCFISESGAVT